MECQILCLLAASIGFSAVDNVDWCKFCGDLQITMDDCIDDKLDVDDCRLRHPDQQVYVYCVSIAQKYSSGAVNVIKRCVDKEAYKADILTLDKQMLNMSVQCSPSKPSNFQNCQCGDLCRIATTTTTTTTTTATTTTTTTTTTTESTNSSPPPESTNSSPPSEFTNSSSPLTLTAIKELTTETNEETITVADEPDDCSHVRAPASLIIFSVNVVMFRFLHLKAL